MAKIVQTAGRNALGEFAPEFAHYNDDVLFGENWNNQDIDVKTRSIITVVALMAQGITDSSLKFHLQNAKAHGVTQKEIAAIITHAAFYAGWPKGWAVFNLAKEVWEPGEGDLPYEDEAAFEELCGFLQEEKIQRAGAFPYSPEEGTPAAKMLNRVDSDQAQSRAELIMQLQSQVMDQFNESRLGTTLEVLCDGFDPQAMAYAGRSWAESPGIDGNIYFTAEGDVQPGEFVPVRITGIMDGDLTGEVTEEE